MEVSIKSISHIKRLRIRFTSSTSWNHNLCIFIVQMCKCMFHIARRQTWLILIHDVFTLLSHPPPSLLVCLSLFLSPMLNEIMKKQNKKNKAQITDKQGNSLRNYSFLPCIDWLAHSITLHSGLLKTLNEKKHIIPSLIPVHQYTLQNVLCAWVFYAMSNFVFRFMQIRGTNENPEWLWFYWVIRPLVLG